jgi:SAM-dependent methyltransferase
VKLIPKLKLSPALIRFAYNFVDVEASGETALPSERIIEYSFIISKLAQAPKGKVLDVGCAARINILPATLALLGHEVWGIDIREFKFKWPDFHFHKKDITAGTSFSDGFFDYVIAVSTLEHLGLGGRYGISKDDLEADARTLKEIKRILKPTQTGVLLVTLPYGKRKIVRNSHKVYDKAWLRELFDDWRIKLEKFYARNKDGYLEEVPEEKAARYENQTGEDAVAILELLPL